MRFKMKTRAGRSLLWCVLLWWAHPLWAQGEEEKAVPDSALRALNARIEDLEQRLQDLNAKQEETALQQLLRQAEAAASQKPAAAEETKVFRGGQRSLQAINPELSVTGDFLSHYLFESPHHCGLERSGNDFRVVALHLRSDLDPFSYTKMAIEVHPESVELGEAYVVWSGEIPGVSLTVGKFRQQFGVVNRWHAHSLDQAFFPLALGELLGPEGLNQTGFSAAWTVPQYSSLVQRLTVEVTNSQNGHLFSGASYSAPALLVHLNNYRDLTRNTYAELGLTGMTGENHVADAAAPTENEDSAPGHQTRAGGADLTLFWEPLNRAHYSNLLWRSELYYVAKDLPQHEKLTAWGGYSYVQRKMGERLEIGLRGDWSQPFAPSNSGQRIFQIVPYATWWQSHWVRLRCEFQHRDGNALDRAQNRAWFQVTWAAGPHKHERY